MLANTARAFLTTMLLIGSSALSSPAQAGPIIQVRTVTHAPVRIAPRPSPPKLIIVRPVQPSARHAWISGRWSWTGASWSWMPGHWRAQQPVVRNAPVVFVQHPRRVDVAQPRSAQRFQTIRTTSTTPRSVRSQTTRRVFVQR
jgi:hypothetical protein